MNFKQKARASQQIQISPLRDCPQHIPTLSKIWHDALGEAWGEDYTASRMEQILSEQLNADQIPIAITAVLDDEPIGMCCIRASEDIKPYIVPCLGALCVRPELRNNGVGAALVRAAIKINQEIGFSRLYLFTVDMTISKWYEQFGFYSLGIKEWEDGSSSVMMECNTAG